MAEEQQYPVLTPEDSAAASAEEAFFARAREGEPAKRGFRELAQEALALAKEAVTAPFRHGQDRAEEIIEERRDANIVTNDETGDPHYFYRSDVKVPAQEFSADNRGNTYWTDPDSPHYVESTVQQDFKRNMGIADAPDDAAPAAAWPENGSPVEADFNRKMGIVKNPDITEFSVDAALATTWPESGSSVEQGFNAQREKWAAEHPEEAALKDGAPWPDAGSIVEWEFKKQTGLADQPDASRFPDDGRPADSVGDNEIFVDGDSTQSPLRSNQSASGKNAAAPYTPIGLQLADGGHLTPPSHQLLAANPPSMDMDEDNIPLALLHTKHSGHAPEDHTLPPQPLTREELYAAYENDPALQLAVLQQLRKEPESAALGNDAFADEFQRRIGIAVEARLAADDAALLQTSRASVAETASGEHQESALQSPPPLPQSGGHDTALPDERREYAPVHELRPAREEPELPSVIVTEPKEPEESRQATVTLHPDVAQDSARLQETQERLAQFQPEFAATEAKVNETRHPEWEVQRSYHRFNQQEADFNAQASAQPVEAEDEKFRLELAATAAGIQASHLRDVLKDRFGIDMTPDDSPEHLKDAPHKSSDRLKAVRPDTVVEDATVTPLSPAATHEAQHAEAETSAPEGKAVSAQKPARSSNPLIRSVVAVATMVVAAVTWVVSQVGHHHEETQGAEKDRSAMNTHPQGRSGLHEAHTASESRMASPDEPLPPSIPAESTDPETTKGAPQGGHAGKVRLARNTGLER